MRARGYSSGLASRRLLDLPEMLASALLSSIGAGYLSRVLVKCSSLTQLNLASNSIGIQGGSRATLGLVVFGQISVWRDSSSRVQGSKVSARPCLFCPGCAASPWTRTGCTTAGLSTSWPSCQHARRLPCCQLLAISCLRRRQRHWSVLQRADSRHAAAVPPHPLGAWSHKAGSQTAAATSEGASRRSVAAADCRC